MNGIRYASIKLELSPRAMTKLSSKDSSAKTIKPYSGTRLPYRNFRLKRRPPAFTSNSKLAATMSIDDTKIHKISAKSEIGYTFRTPCDVKLRTIPSEIKLPDFDEDDCREKANAKNLMYLIKLFDATTITLK